MQILSTAPQNGLRNPESATKPSVRPAPGQATTIPQAIPGQAAIRPRKSIRLLLADDHPVVRKGVRAVLSRFPHLEVVGEAADGRQALSQVRELKPDILLTDLEMPQMTGLAVTEVLRKEMPQVKVLILSMHRNTETVLRILKAGARGYVLKEAPPEELVQAIETVESGETFFSPDI